MRTEDGTIIQKCLDGESEAFGILIDKYKAGIFALVWHKIRNFHDAEEITQEVFIKAYKHLRTLRRWDSFGVWLYSIAHEGCRKWFRSQLRRPDHVLTEDGDVEELKESDAIDSNRDGEMYDSLHDALDSLPEIYQEVLTLHYFGGLTGDEMAKLMCISPSAVRQRLSRARAQLKEEMIAMMGETFREHKLQAGFTFQIVEIIERIKIQPASTTKNLPFALSLAVGIAVIIMSLNPNFSQTMILDELKGFPLPVETKVLKFGEIPVDILKIDKISVISTNQRDGISGENIPPKPQDKLSPAFMSPAKEGQWTTKADMQDGRDFFATCAVGGKIYAIGGSTKDQSFNLATVERYDPEINMWMMVANITTPRCLISANAIDEKIYVIGGTDNNWPLNLPVLECDTAKDKWTTKGIPPTPICAHCSAVVNGKIYVFGGLDAISLDSVKSVFEYDPESDKWTRKADMPTAKLLASANAVDGKIYVIGGANRWLWADGDRHAFSTVEEYDPATDKWTTKTDMPTVNVCHTSSVVNGKIYIIGGSKAPSDHVIETYKYDPKQDMWEQVADIPTPRILLSSSEVNGSIYTIGGRNIIAFPVLPLVEEYTPEETKGNSVYTDSKLPTTWGETKSR